MLSFPTIAPPNSPLKGKIENHTYKGESDGVTILTRPKMTKTVYSFTPKWDAMVKSDFLLLRNFYDVTTSGGALEFYWTHPNEGAEANNVYRVRFDGDLEWDLSNLGYYSISFTIKGYKV